MLLNELRESEYTVSYVNVMRNYWSDGETWSCLGQPKEHHMLLYFDGCSAVYNMKNGKELRAESGAIMYIPAGSEYKAVFFTQKGARPSTLGVNFTLRSDDGKPLSDTDGICVFEGEAMRSSMVEIERLSYSLCDVPMKYNTLIYGIFNTLGDRLDGEESGIGFELIRAGVEYLHKHFDGNSGVEELARACNISSVYFRRLFKKQTGMTPTEYRTHLRLVRAAELLRFGELSVSEISERLGFADSSYFVKRFKEKYGETPLSYRKGETF